MQKIEMLFLNLQKTQWSTHGTAKIQLATLSRPRTAKIQLATLSRPRIAKIQLATWSSAESSPLTGA
jgi:hypothetical protein